MDKSTYIEDIPVIELGGEVYKTSDTNLITAADERSSFDPDVDYIEYFIYDGNKTLTLSEERLETYNLYANNLLIDPEKDLESRIQGQGKYYTAYNFLRPLLASSVQETYYIQEISSDRTEIRLNTTAILAQDVQEGVQAIQAEIADSSFYVDFYLNFGENRLLIANNLLLDNSNPDQPTVLIKLYEPLPSTFSLNTECWAVNKVAESRAYLINVAISFEIESDLVKIQGPNLSTLSKGIVNTSNQPTNYTSLTETPSASLFYELSNKLNTPGITLNTDYSDFGNFVFFTTTRTRLENYYYKLNLLEEYQYSASINTETTDPYNFKSLKYWQDKIQETVTGFDGYESYLYYQSGSTNWPKVNSTPPYINVPTTSSAGQTWLESTLVLADSYDDANKDRLVNTIPEYIKDNTSNLNYELFVDMVAQIYDEIWVYLGDVTEKYNTTSGIDRGISKDLIGEALRDVGIKLYENNFTSENLYNSYLGITPSGSLLPNTGQEFIDTYVTASATGSLIPIKNLTSEVYKRLYHNLPALLKKKGTVAGLRTLINAYGVPETILRVTEFGGKDTNQATWDSYQWEYSYALRATGSYYLSSSFTLNTDWNATNNVPSAVEFRFKPDRSDIIPPSQSIWHTDTGIGVFLEYTAPQTASYSGSGVDPYSDYATLKFITAGASASIELPFFNGTWWAVLVNSGSTGYQLYAKNNEYQGINGYSIGYQRAGTVSNGVSWASSQEIYFNRTTGSYQPLEGVIQEIRYYTETKLEQDFNDFVMNPCSIKGSEYLAFRASLGGELYTASLSIHPKVTGPWESTSSFSTGNSYYFSDTPIYIENIESNLYNQPTAGIKNAVTNKVLIQPKNVYGDTLSTLESLQQSRITNLTDNPNTNYLEVGYSPQNEINEDIVSTLGHFNIGEYIGDPRFTTSPGTTYSELERLKNTYFEKYRSSYNYQDYFRIIKFYDNSLFKLIKDFIPARTAAATGAIVKQHLLERNRQTPPQITYTRPEYTASATSVARGYESGSIGIFNGGSGGAIDRWVDGSQSYTASILGPEGLVTFVESSKYEFINGAYSGSTVECQLSESINYTPLMNNVSSSRLSIKYQDVDYTSNVLNPINLPLILSGSAQKAAIQDSNYDVNSAFFETRFAGTKNTGEYNFTEQLASQSISDIYPIDYFTSYFAYSDWIGGSNPQYPGGGNIHCIYLINAETEEVFTLSQENKYLETIAQVFKKEDPVFLIPSTIESGNQVYTSTIVEGGALYNTVVYKSGSNINNEGFIANYSSSQPAFTGSFSLVTGPTLRDTGTANAGWFYALNTTSSSANGMLDPERSFGIPSGSNYGIYNRRTGGFVTASTAPFIQGAFSSSIAYRDTYLPIRQNDFIRFGFTPDSPYGVDEFFNLSSLTQIKEITLGADSGNTSILNILDLTSIPVAERQNYRIFRRVPDETFILINNLTYTGAGLILPKNLNPKYDPVKIAKDLGVI